MMSSTVKLTLCEWPTPYFKLISYNHGIQDGYAQSEVVGVLIGEAQNRAIQLVWLIGLEEKTLKQ